MQMAEILIQKLQTEEDAFESNLKTAVATAESQTSYVSMKLNLERAVFRRCEILGFLRMSDFLAHRKQEWMTAMLQTDNLLDKIEDAFSACQAQNGERLSPEKRMRTAILKVGNLNSN